MADPNTQSEQPDAERRVGLRGGGPAPRATVIHQHLIGQAIASEHLAQARLDGRATLIGTRFQPKRVARVIVQDGQRMDATVPLRQRHMAFEVHLPQLIGQRSFKASPSMRHPLGGLEPTVPTQNLGHRAGPRRHLAALLQARRDLAATPGRMRIAECEHVGLDLG